MLLLFIIVGLFDTAAEEAVLRLRLESPVRTLRVNEITRPKLMLIGSEVHEIIEQTDGISTYNPETSAFVYEFTFHPQKEGEYMLGPYSITVNGRELTSKQILITVLPKWNGEFGTFFRVDRDSIVLGEDIELHVETWVKAADSESTPSLTPSRVESFSWTAGDSGVHGGKLGERGEPGFNENSTYTRRSWFITPKKAGAFRISKELFKAFPEDIPPPDITIMVKEPAESEETGSTL